MLRIRIDTSKQIAHFSGPSTFHAKETIKQLGNARFIGEEKAWEVSSFSGGPEQLKAMFGGFQLEIEVTGELPATPSRSDSGDEVPKGLSVPQLIATVKGVLEKSFPGGALVYGVISSVKVGQGRTFLTLADPVDRMVTVNCAYWGDIDRIQQQLAPHGFKLESDLEVMLQVGVSVNSKNGNLSLRVQRIIPEYTLSKLLGERDKTNKRLKEEGLFDRNKKLTLPPIITRVGVLTSSGGTVIHDFCGALEPAAFGFELFWFPIAVQGKDAQNSILKGFDALCAREDLDAILLFRGGGSTGDLAVFNRYEVARAVCLAPVPVLCAIGHQQDHCSAQDVSHTAFGVPRDIGNELARRIIESRNNVRTFSQNILSLGESTIERAGSELRRTAELLLQRSVRTAERAEERVSTLVGRLDIQGSRTLERGAERLSRTSELLARGADRIVQRAEERLQRTTTLHRSAELLLERKAEQLERLSMHISDAAPEVQMKRGFSIVRAKDKFVRSASALNAGDEISIQFVDGTRDATITGESDGRSKS